MSCKGEPTSCGCHDVMRQDDFLPLCRFFLRREDWVREFAFYESDGIRDALPALHAAADHGKNARSQDAHVYPPYLVVERGTCLTEWLRSQRSSEAVHAMVLDVAAQLAKVHDAGLVHRDIKPGNVLFMLRTQAWRLIDFGIAATAGAHLHSFDTHLISGLATWAAPWQLPGSPL